MSSFLARAICSAILLVSASARVTPPGGGNVLACHDQGCDNCTAYANVNAGYPHCITYDTAATLGASFSNTNGIGYSVWWDSGPPDTTCKIIVRTPASTDLPMCGYYLTSWDQPGCYYTQLQQTFMLQFCCGTGDCGSATPARSIEDARLQARSGNTTMVSLMLGNLETLGESGKRSIEGVGEIGWKQTFDEEAGIPEFESPESDSDIFAPDSESHIEHRDVADVGGECKFNRVGDMITEGYNQYKASRTVVCNTPGGCSLTASVAVTEGYSTSPTLTGNFYGIISAAVGYTFTKSITYTASEGFTQNVGTTGYMSYIPTYNCWHGTFDNCADNINGNIVKIDPSQTYYACTPALLNSGQGDGTFSFVYVQ